MMIGDLRERAVGQRGDAVDGTAAGEGTLDGEVEGAAGSETGRWLAHGRARL